MRQAAKYTYLYMRACDQLLSAPPAWRTRRMHRRLGALPHTRRPITGPQFSHAWLSCAPLCGASHIQSCSVARLSAITMSWFCQCLTALGAWLHPTSGAKPKHEYHRVPAHGAEEVCGYCRAACCAQVSELRMSGQVEREGLLADEETGARSGEAGFAPYRDEEPADMMTEDQIRDLVDSQVCARCLPGHLRAFEMGAGAGAEAAAWSCTCRLTCWRAAQLKALAELDSDLHGAEEHLATARLQGRGNRMSNMVGPAARAWSAVSLNLCSHCRLQAAPPATRTQLADGRPRALARSPSHRA